MASPRELFPELLPEEPTPFRVVHHQVEYPGEVLASESWQPAWGEIRERDVHFRLVFLTRPQAVPAPRDPRVACFVPPRAVKEAPASYGAAGRGVSFYQQGRVVASAALALSLRQTFGGGNADAFQRAGAALLGAAHPSLPFRAEAFPRPLGVKEVGQVFQGLFYPDPVPEARLAVRDFAVGLGLATEAAPNTFDASGCRVFALISALLEKGGGGLAFEELYRGLTRDHGLTSGLVVLYTLAFLRANPWPVQVKLKEGHHLAVVSGGRPPENVLLPAQLAQIRWRPGLDLALERLEYLQRPTWDLVLPYARCLVADLGTSAGDAARGENWARLRSRLEELRGFWDEARLALEPLDDASSLQEEFARLGHLRRVLEARDLAGFTAVVGQEYTAPTALEADLARLARLKEVAACTMEIAAARDYLEEVSLRESDAGLAMDRSAILEQMRLGNLLAQPHLWPSIKAMFDLFRSRFCQVYLAQHEAYRRELTSLRQRLLATQGEVKALERLNSLEDLGEPVGQELSGIYDSLLSRVAPCRGLVLEETRPLCRSCGLNLAQTPPAAEVAALVEGLEKALGEQKRRLSAEAIHKILSRKADSRLGQFLQVLQASDMTPLVAVLDDNLVAFLRQLLEEVHTFPCPVLRDLAQKYPSLEESQAEEAVAEFRRLLSQAFGEAKKARPGKRARVSFG